MEQDDGFGLGIRGIAQVEDISVGTQAAQYAGPGRSGDSESLGANRDFAIVSDPNASLLTPNVGPPRASWSWAQDGAVFGESLVTGGKRGSAQFAVDFMLVSMSQQLFQQGVGATQFEDLVGSQERGQALLPVIVATFDLPFGLGGWARSATRRHRNGVPHLTG